MNKIVIQYLTHQELTKIKNLTETNHQFQKIETPHNQTTHNQTTQNKQNHKNKR